MTGHYTFAHGTDSDWAQATRPLAVGEPGMSTTTGAISIGDGATPWSGLPKFYPSAAGAATIDDTVIGNVASLTFPLAGSGSSATTLSSTGIIALANAIYSAAVAFANKAAAGAGGQRVVPVYQNADGTWPTSTAGPNDMTIWSGTVGFGAAPPAAARDWVLLKDSS